MRKHFWMAMRSMARRAGRRSALVIAAAAILAGTAISQRAAAMVGGAPIAATEYGRSVVMILGSSGTACTATAIGRDLLVTADVALVKLAEPLPSRVMSARIGGETDFVNVGDTLVVAGYGVTVRGDGRTGGTARAAALSVTGEPGSLQIRLFDPATKGVNAGLGACAGDSGAPAFRSTAGEARIIGVVSWSTGPNLTAGCGGLTGITPLVKYRGWIVDTARKLGIVLAP